VARARGVCVLVVVGALFALGASSAFASTHVFSTSFGAASNPVPSPANPYPLSEPQGIAVDDASGAVYVSDPVSHWVEKFAAGGALLWIVGKEVNKSAVQASGSTAEQDLCVIASGEQCQHGAEGSSPGAFVDHFEAVGFPGEHQALYLAVDNSTSSSQGDLYVADPGDDLITKLAPDGSVIESWGDNGPLEAANGQLNGAPSQPFGPLRGIAVDPAGTLFVLNESEAKEGFRISRFTPAGSFIGVSGPTGLTFPDPTTGIAVDSAGDVYVSRGEKSVAKFNLSGVELSEEFAPHPATGLATDPNTDELYADLGGEIVRYDSAGEELESFGSDDLTAAHGLAVNAIGGIYAADTTPGRVDAFVLLGPFVASLPATGITGREATLNGRLAPTGGGPITACSFEYVSASLFEPNAPNPYTAGHTLSCTPPTPYSATTKVSAQTTGLNGGTTYRFRLTATDSNKTNTSLDASFTTTGPTIESTSTLAVSATDATLQAELDPQGQPTTYHFEYDTTPYNEDEPPHGATTPTLPAGAGETAISRTVQIQGLTPSTIYHYRLVAENSLGTNQGPDHTLTTQPALSGSPLPDGRAWEMVSPPQKSGAGILGIAETPGGVLQASANGTGLAYVADSSFGQEAPGNRSFQRSQFLAFRGVNGWSTKDVTTPREDVVGVIVGNTEGYKAFSQDLSVGAVQPRGVTPLSPLATEATPYLRLANGEFTPLVDSLDVPPETVFDGKVGSDGLVSNEPEIEGGSADLRSVVIASCSKLTEDAINSCGKGVKSLYVWREGALRLASILPNGKPAASLTGGFADLGAGYPMKRHAVSDDGTRLAFTAVNDLYLHDVTLGKTVQLDLPEPGAAGGAGGARFEDMSADGSKVFFTDMARLAKSSNADGVHPDLYMCEMVMQGESLTCALKDLSVARNAGEAGAVLGSSLGTDSSGSYAYFVANGSLVPGGTQGDCNSDGGAGTGTCGLYMYDTVAGTIKQVATLSDADYLDWAGGSNNASQLTARVSLNGRFLAFMSQRSLTGYDNRDAVSGQPDQEVYLYDRLGDGGEGKLVCASCDPTGARPHGVEIVTDAHSLLNQQGIWGGGTWLAAAIPGWTSFALAESLNQSRYLSDSGRLFFNSADVLVPRDSNGTVDVYEYEPPQGEGQPASNNCTVPSPTYSPTSGGCVDLVSSGTSAEESVFLDASESGDDVFLLTAAQLAPGDFDTADDIYDARVGGVVVEPVKPPACEGDACQNPVSAPEDPTPGSLTFKGPGNPLPAAPVAVRGKAKPSKRALKLARALKVCGREPKRKRAACKRRAQRAYGPVGKAKKSNRGAHR
jgi:hypothetical protein